MTVPAGMTSECAPIKGKLWTPFTAFLAVLVLIMAAVLAVRFARGIGAVTNLNDGYPWGLWIVWDVLIGSALGASGFTVAFAMYILNRGEYHPMVRPALLTALLGYSMAGLSVVVDIGRYWNAWHIVWPRYMQPSSVLFEVALCIMAYTAVIAIELSPAVLEKLGMKRARKTMGRFLFFFVAIGIVLPTMHQSSLGSMLLVYGRQIDPIYQTRALPILFLTSTVGMGLAAVTLEGTISSLALGRPIESDMLAKLMKVCRVVIAGFLLIRFADLAIRGVLPQVVAPTTVALMFWIETALFVFSISLLGDAPSIRRVAGSAMAMALAGILYRIDAYLVAYHTGPGWHYFPSMGEIAVTVGLIAFKILAFIFAIRIFPVMQTKH